MCECPIPCHAPACSDMSKSIPSITMRAEVEGGLDEDPGTPTNARSPWLSLNDGSETVVLDEPGINMSQRAKISDLGMRDELDLVTYGYALRVA